jgi:hypothetical protein
VFVNLEFVPIKLEILPFVVNKLSEEINVAKIFELVIPVVKSLFILDNEANKFPILESLAYRFEIDAFVPIRLDVFIFDILEFVRTAFELVKEDIILLDRVEFTILPFETIIFTEVKLTIFPFVPYNESRLLVLLIKFVNVPFVDDRLSTFAFDKTMLEIVAFVMFV